LKTGFTGDGIMAVFGAPVAFEDAPLQAGRSASKQFTPFSRAFSKQMQLAASF
jgi:class 3 adenylate cyclase